MDIYIFLGFENIPFFDFFNFIYDNSPLKVFDVIYPFAFHDVKLNKLDANLLDFVAYISVELVVEFIGRVCF